MRLTLPAVASALPNPPANASGGRRPARHVVGDVSAAKGLLIDFVDAGDMLAFAAIYSNANITVRSRPLPDGTHGHS